MVDLHAWIGAWKLSASWVGVVVDRDVLQDAVVEVLAVDDVVAVEVFVFE